MLLSWFNEQRHRSRSASPRCARSFAAQREGQRVEGEDGEGRLGVCACDMHAQAVRMAVGT